MLAIFDGDVTLFKAAYGAKDLDHAYDNAMRIFDSQAAEIWATKRVVYVAGSGNYRKDVFVDYKMNKSRVDSKNRNPYWFGLKQRLVERKVAIPSDGFEADDLVCRKAYHCYNRGQEYTVITIDKDLDAIVGPHLKPPIKRGAGCLHYNMSVADAKRHYWIQVMTGDMVDNIKGLPGVGAKGAAKLLDGLNHGDSMRDAVIKKYKEVMGTEWLHAIMFTGSLIHIHRKQNDHFNIGKGTWFELTAAGKLPLTHPKGYNYVPFVHPVKEST